MPFATYLCSYKDRLKAKGLRKEYHAHTNPKKARVAIVISNKVDYRARIITRDYFRMIKAHSSRDHNNPKCVCI